MHSILMAYTPAASTTLVRTVSEMVRDLILWTQRESLGQFWSSLALLPPNRIIYSRSSDSHNLWGKGKISHFQGCFQTLFTVTAPRLVNTHIKLPSADQLAFSIIFASPIPFLFHNSYHF